tara:strand:+ start:135 stop:380 length:246 start_codon:yes stop_codon:yes gene_type:complete
MLQPTLVWIRAIAWAWVLAAMAAMTPARGVMVRDQGVTRVLSAVQITMPPATTPAQGMMLQDPTMMAWEPMTAQSMRTAEL